MNITTDDLRGTQAISDLTRSMPAPVCSATLESRLPIGVGVSLGASPNPRFPDFTVHLLIQFDDQPETGRVVLLSPEMASALARELAGLAIQAAARRSAQQPEGRA